VLLYEGVYDEYEEPYDRWPPLHAGHRAAAAEER